MWLQQLLNLKPAKWPLGRSIRMAVSLGLPLSLAVITHQPLVYLWITLGALMQASGEGNGSYRSTFRITLIAALIGSLGYLALNLWNTSGPIAITILTVAAFVAGIVNSYGAAYSKGTLQALIGASVIYGLGPELHGSISSWKIISLYWVGTAWYLCLLGIEALINKNRPQRTLIANYLNAIAAFAQAHSNHLTSPNSTTLQQQETTRNQVIDNYELLYGVLIDARSQNNVRSKENQHNAAILQAADNVFSHVLAQKEVALLQSISQWLQDVAAAIAHNKPQPPLPTQLQFQVDERVYLRLQALSQSLATLDQVISFKFNLAFNQPHLPRLLDKIIVGTDVLKTTAVLALCMGIAFSMKYVLHGNHWYWVPLTVSLVMKPELGSIFARAVLRLIGTALGVIVGTLILATVPKGFFMVLLIVAIAACMPWAMLRSYALLSFFITPMVLLLIDLISPGTANINYAGQRLTDTAIGGAIALIFGYFIWPRSHEKQLDASYQSMMNTLAQYLSQAANADESLQSTRRLVYSQLSNLRAQLQKQLSEPPPSSVEAAHWFPLLACAERITDHITISTENSTSNNSLIPAKDVTQVTQKMLDVLHTDPRPQDRLFSYNNTLLDGILNELGSIYKLSHTISTRSP